MTPCRRECWECKNVADHEDNITPHVLCKKCGSQDTRLIRTPPRPLQPGDKVLVEAEVLHVYTTD